MGKKCTPPGQIFVSSHAIKKTQQETETERKGPESNTNNHKTTTPGTKRKTLMPAQNQSNQPNSKPSHYTTGQITKDSKRNQLYPPKYNSLRVPQECLSTSSQYIIIAIIIVRRAPSNQQLASHNVVRVVKSNLAAPHKGGQPHHGVQNAKAGFGSGRCSGHLRRQGPQGKQKGGIVCGLGGDSRCKFYTYPTRRLL